MRRIFDWKNWPSWVKLVVALAALAGCLALIYYLNIYMQIVPQPAPDKSFMAMPEPKA